ncbi:MAG: DegT/DnrJ/EryC1/StrS family aminotransferase [Candidatus Shapirobacteria bacterium]|jgi:dTDP-4-amino-4,6-dideoxygalactose transaminase
MKPFKKPIYITRPLFPPLAAFNGKLKEVWKSKWLSNNGIQLQTLEKKIKKILKVPQVSIFNNGTIALLTAIKSLDLKGEVVTTPFTFPATPNCLTWCNIKPVFCDIDPLTMNIDSDQIEKNITKKTTAILPVHVFGTPCDVEKIQKIANDRSLKVIYDAAHAFETEIDGVGIGNFGDISMFSFHPTKLFHTGEGGTLICKDELLKEKIDLLRNFGIIGEEVLVPGINGKMNEIQAVLGLVVLSLVNTERKKRMLISRMYQNHLDKIEGITYLKDRPNVKKSYQYFVIRIDKRVFGRSRDEVSEILKTYNIYPRKYFFPLCSQYPYYKNLPSSNPTNLPNAHRVVQEVLALPFYGGLPISAAEKIIELLVSLKK